MQVRSLYVVCQEIDGNTLHGFLNVGIFKHYERRIATQLHAYPLQRFGALAGQHLAHGSASGEREMPDEFMLCHLASTLSCRVRRASDNVQHPVIFASSSALEQLGQRNSTQRRLGRRLAHDAVSCRDRSADLARDHCNGTVPRRNGCDDTLRLANRDDPVSGPCGRDRVSVEALDLRLEKVEERRAIVDGAERVGKGFAELECAERCQIVAARFDGIAPAAEEEATCSVGDVAVFLEAEVRAIDGAGDV